MGCYKTGIYRVYNNNHFNKFSAGNRYNTIHDCSKESE